MAKGPFHFKRFSVQQDGAAMKVGTDGIVLGCWTPVEDVQLAIDAGAGNGYVGIMLLQRMAPGGHVVGVELEPGAALQAEENYAVQPFPGVTAECSACALQDLGHLRPDLVGQADLMVSNPPYFRNKPKSPIAARNLARHDDTLGMGDLVKAAHLLLRPGGRLCTIWPYDRLEEWQSWAEGAGFHVERTVHITTMAHLPCKRFIAEWRKRPCLETPSCDEHLTLEGEATLDFTEDYLRIVRPYLRGT